MKYRKNRLARGEVPTIVWMLKQTKLKSNGCMEWIHGRHNYGYGKQQYRGQILFTHRIIAHMTLRMPLTSKQIVRHTCDNPPCINPKHLVLGTKRDNARDMVERGRSIRGSQVPTSKLNAKAVRKIRSLRLDGWPYHKIAKMFAVQTMTIFAVANRRTWKHVK